MLFPSMAREEFTDPIIDALRSIVPIDPLFRASQASMEDSKEAISAKSSLSMSILTISSIIMGSS